MALSIKKIVDAVTYAVGTAQYINIPAGHRMAGRSISIIKNSGSGTLDIHPIEVSVDGSNWHTAWSTNGGALNSPNAEATNQTAYAFSLNHSFPFMRLKIDVNTDTVNLTVTVASNS